MKTLITASKIVQSWNFLNVNALNDALFDDVEYQTNFDLVSIIGSDQVTSFLASNFENFRRRFNNGECGLFSRVVSTSTNPLELFVLIDYMINGMEYSILVDWIEEETKIKSFRFIPLPEDQDLIIISLI